MMSNPAIEITDTLLRDLCRAVVVNPDTLSFSVNHGAASTSFSVTPDEEEAGNMIGKSGRTVKAFTLLSKLIGSRHGWPVLYGVATDSGANPPQKDRGEVEEKVWNLKTNDSLLRATVASFLQDTASVRVLENSRRRTTWEIVLSENEPKLIETDVAVAAALNTIFSAIGKLHGRTCCIAFVRTGNTEQEPQPATARGRYAEVKPA